MHSLKHLLPVCFFIFELSDWRTRFQGHEVVTREVVSLVLRVDPPHNAAGNHGFVRAYPRG